MMNDTEILKIYESAYKEEFDTYFTMANTFSEQARDKKYAFEFGASAIGLMYAFRNSSEIEQEIVQTFDHHYKLGASVPETIRSIPEIIERHKIKANEWHKNNKNDVNVEYKKLFGIIPYGVKHIAIKGNGRMGSPFESLTTEAEIASELGKQRAIIDLLEQFRAKYIELGGMELTPEISPIPLETLQYLKNALANNDLQKFFDIIKSVFASLPYDMKITEGYFHSHIHFLLTLLGVKILSELETNIGRIDSVIESERYIHIIEFKQNDSSIAMDQILEKKYYQRYLNSNKKIILVGVAVDKEERNIIDWQFQSYL